MSLEAAMETDSGVEEARDLSDEVLRMSTDEIVSRARLLDNEIKIMRSEYIRISNELAASKERSRENRRRSRSTRPCPTWCPTWSSCWRWPRGVGREKTERPHRSGRRSAKASAPSSRPPPTRPTFCGHRPGREPESSSPVILVGVNKDSYLIWRAARRVRLPRQGHGSRCRPTERYSDIGGLDKQIQELIEAVVLPHHDPQRKVCQHWYQTPKGVLLYGPPGTGKTLMARACAAQTKSTFLKLAGPQLVQMFIGDGAKLRRQSSFDELDAIGTKRFDSEKAGDREVQRTMLELLNQLDGLSRSTTDIKVIARQIGWTSWTSFAASGRLDRKIEFPGPAH
ncbi:hypothetical protein TCAL_17236 [Tigriopus californicus]|uniref:ATPase AAA-type core domain-containing protein n=1 Tax=Tigriopus californicus TaxID=6832 RepID=A0A553N6U4_TIGCA|nr:hypothetical protein TCAL_17236 [Tigriopus californicus]